MHPAASVDSMKERRTMNDPKSHIILVPVDFSSHSEEAMKLASERSSSARKRKWNSGTN